MWWKKLFYYNSKIYSKKCKFIELSKNKKENNMEHLNKLKNLTKEVLKELIPQIFYPLFSPRKSIKMYIENTWGIKGKIIISLGVQAELDR